MVGRSQGRWQPVALRKESVDRNCDLEAIRNPEAVSLSARRAWIEMWHIHGFLYGLPKVALRKESVDRNPGVLGWSPVGLTSLSARRAWIEIWVFLVVWAVVRVSLSARRAWIEIPSGCWRDARRACRSPQGERG